MARPYSKRSLEVIAACKEHLMIDGPKDWAAVKRRWPDLPRSTFERLCEVAKQEIERTAAEAGPDDLRRAQARIRRNLETPETINSKIRAHLPASPSPAVVAGMDPATSARVFDFMAYFFNIVNDADMLRNKAVRKETGADGMEREVLANPMLMDNSIRRRLQIMDTYLQSMQELFNLDKLQELYRVVIDEVGKADPAVQQAILARLRVLNDKTGLTMAARIL